MKKPIISNILIVAVAAIASAQNNGEGFDKYAEAARQECKVPGMSVDGHTGPRCVGQAAGKTCAHRGSHGS